MAISKCFNANDILSVDILSSERCRVSFLNWKGYALNKNALSPKGILPTDLQGPGLYGLCFRADLSKSDWKLIYIGSYLGKNINPFSGNVARDRWWTHIASVTMRGHRVSISEGVLNSAKGILFPNSNSSAQSGLLFRPLISALPNLTPKGCITTINRIKFAYRHQKFFLTVSPNKFLGHFKFVYVRVDPAIKTKVGQFSVCKKNLRESIEHAEKELIHNWAPECNEGNGSAVPVNCGEVQASLERSINRIEEDIKIFDI